MFVTATAKTNKRGGLAGPLVTVQVECHASDHIPLKWFRKKVTQIIDKELYDLGLIPNSTIFYTEYTIMERKYLPYRENGNTLQKV